MHRNFDKFLSSWFIGIIFRFGILPVRGISPDSFYFVIVPSFIPVQITVAVPRFLVMYIIPIYQAKAPSAKKCGKADWNSSAIIMPTLAAFDQI